MRFPFFFSCNYFFYFMRSSNRTEYKIYLKRYNQKVHNTFLMVAFSGSCSIYLHTFLFNDLSYLWKLLLCDLPGCSRFSWIFLGLDLMLIVYMCRQTCATVRRLARPLVLCFRTK